MRLRSLLLPFAALSALLAGCSAPAPSVPEEPTTNGLELLEAAEILQRASDALEAAGSFRMSGKAGNEGFVLEVDLLIADEDFQGSLSTLGQELELLMVDGEKYVRGGEDIIGYLFAKQITAGQELPDVQGKWVKLPADQAGSLMGRITLHDLYLADGVTATKGDVTTLGGVQVIVVTTESDEEDGLDGEWYISLESEPYPLQIVTEQGTIEISDVGDDVTIEAPDASDVIEITEP